MIGKVGTILGDQKINIDYMSLGRTAETATMALSLDREIPPEIYATLKEIPGMMETHLVSFPKQLNRFLWE